MANIDSISSEDFLDIVWGEGHGWVDLPAKVGGYWVPWHYEYEGEADNEITRRIDACLRDSESLYFSAGRFTEKGRNFDDLTPPQWLWADLDEIHPTSAATGGVLPTLAWESSPGRYQAMWRLQRRISASTFDKLNQALSYFLGADHGGWDRTQVLRLPGTRNFKYAGGPEVRLLWYHEELKYKAKYIWSVVGDSLPAQGSATLDGVSDTPARAMPSAARSLLRVPSDSVVEGERSAQLWRLECLLAESNWGEDAIYTVVADSAWNKWASVSTGERRLRNEIRKAIAHVARRKALSHGRGESGAVDRRGDTGVSDRADSDTAGSPVEDDGTLGGGDSTDDSAGHRGVDDEQPSELLLSLPFVRYGSFMAMAMEEPRWLIENLWTAGSHGIIGGEPKTSKTTLGLGMAIAVASGKPFLGCSEYRVRTPGPVILVQEENAPWMVQDRMRKIAALSGLIPPAEVTTRRAARGGLSREIVEIEFPTDIPLRLLNNWGLDLTNEEHRDALWAECEVVRPKLVLLDPWYLLFAGLDFNQAHEVAPYLKWLLAMRNEFNCAVVLIHHFRKQGANHTRAGQRLMGSATLHGWVDSALYAEQMDPESIRDKRRKSKLFTRVEREFRSIEPQKALEIGMSMGDPGNLDMTVEIGKWDVQRTIEDLVFEQPGVTVIQLADLLGMDKRTVLGRCRASDVIFVKTGARGRGHSHTVYPQSENGDGHES